MFAALFLRTRINLHFPFGQCLAPTCLLAQLLIAEGFLIHTKGRLASHVNQASLQAATFAKLRIGPLKDLRIRSDSWRSSGGDERGPHNQAALPLFSLLQQCLEFRDYFQISRTTCRALDLNKFWEAQAEALHSKEVQGNRVCLQLIITAAPGDLAEQVQRSQR